MTIIPTETFHKLAEAIARLEPCPFAGVLTDDQVKAAMVEVADVVPMSLVEAALAE